MKTCPRCIRQNEDSANYCVDCKYAFSAGVSTQDEPPVPEIRHVPPSIDEPAIPFNIGMDGLGESFAIYPFGRVTNATRMHVGQFFETYKAQLGPREVCLKTIRRGRVSGHQMTLSYGSYFTQQRPSTLIFPAGGLSKTPSQCVLSALLQLEMEKVRLSDGCWHHQIFGIGTVERVGLEGFVPIAVMPYHAAAPLASISGKQQILPRVMLPLWDALTKQSHGDLNERNILVREGGREAILIDPGVFLAFQNTSVFTTTAQNYPFLFPHPQPWGQWCEGLTLRDLNGAGSGPVRRRWVDWDWDALRKRPSAADIHALALIYYRTLRSTIPCSCSPDDVACVPCLTDALLNQSRSAERPFWSREAENPVWAAAAPLGISLLTRIECAVSNIRTMFPPEEARLLKALLMLEVKDREELTALVDPVVGRSN